MSNHSVIEHRANYHFLKVEEDFLAICSNGKESPHCKALILAILEHWTNTKRDQDQGDYVYMTLPEWEQNTYLLYARNVLINCIKELLEEKLIDRRDIKRYDQDTYEYKLNVEVIQVLIRALPEKAPKDPAPNLVAYHTFVQKKKDQREEERKAKEQGSLKINYPVVEKSTALKNKRRVREKSTALKNKRRVREKSTTSSSEGSLKINDGSLKNQRNIDSIPDSSLASQPTLSPSLNAQDDAVEPLKEKPAKTELSSEQKTRARAIKAKIEDRCGVLSSAGPNIAENKAVAKLVQKYNDADIDDVEHYLLHCHFKWSKPDFKFKIRGNIILDEMEPTLKLFAENPKLRDATSAPAPAFKPAQSEGMKYKRLPPVPTMPARQAAGVR